MILNPYCNLSHSNPNTSIILIFRKVGGQQDFSLPPSQTMACFMLLLCRDGWQACKPGKICQSTVSLARHLAHHGGCEDQQTDRRTDKNSKQQAKQEKVSIVTLWPMKMVAFNFAGSSMIFPGTGEGFLSTEPVCSLLVLGLTVRHLLVPAWCMSGTRGRRTSRRRRGKLSSR